MVDRPSQDTSGPRIRQTPSTVRSGQGTRNSRSHKSTSTRPRRNSYDDDELPSPSTQSQRRNAGRVRKARAESTSAARAWMAALFALCISFLKRSPVTGTSALYDAILEKRDFERGVDTRRPLSVEIFAAPKPFRGEDAEHQTRAIESWIALRPRPKVTLLGTGEGYEEVVRTYNLNWRKQVDTTFLGVPLFSSIVAAANQSQADVAVIANSDILFFDDFTFAIRKINRDAMKPWMLLGARWDIPYVPQNLLRLRNNHRKRPPERERRRMVRFARENGTLHTYGGIDVWAWNTNAGARLYDGTMPNFVFGRGKYDNWLTHEVIAAGHRKIIDASEACTFVHVVHDHHLVTSENSAHLAGGAGNSSHHRALLSTSRSFWNDGARVKFELYINTYLAAAHGSYTTQMGTILHAPFKLQSCYEEEGLCFFFRRRPSSCRCEHSTFVRSAQSDPFALNDTRIIFCGLQSSDALQQDASDADTLYRFVISGRERAYASSVKKMGPQGLASTDKSYVHGVLLKSAGSAGSKFDDLDQQRGGSPFGLPLLLPRLLDVIEQRTGRKQVVLTLLNSNHKSLLQRFVCSARRAGVFQSLVVAALDDETYHFAITRGIAVYLEETVYTNDDEEGRAMDAQFASPGFNILTSLRGRVTHKLTGVGFQVFYADPDVMLQENPFESLPRGVGEVAVLGSGELQGQQLGAHSSDSKQVPGEGVRPAPFSTAMIYARPGKMSEAFLKRIGQVMSGEESGQKLMEAAKGTEYSILAVGKYVNAVAELPEERGESVAIHIGARGEAHTKIEAMAHRDWLDLYDDLIEVCRTPQDTEQKWGWAASLRGR